MAWEVGDLKYRRLQVVVWYLSRDAVRWEPSAGILTRTRTPKSFLARLLPTFGRKPFELMPHSTGIFCNFVRLIRET